MTVPAYYNEIDPYCCEWLRNLIKAGHIPAGDVDERSIRDVAADDLRGYGQCHFFAGIGGWSYAARLAGWPDDRPMWTGSCPCQPFSVAGKRNGFEDARHLWPEWFRLIKKCKPTTVFGEQVAEATRWFDSLADDLESEDYAVAAFDLPAACVGAKHKRQRLWFVADANGKPEVRAAVPRMECNPWDAEPALGRVVDGLSHRLVEPELRALGNAIVPQVAAEIIRAFL